MPKRPFDRDRWIKRYVKKALDRMWYWYPVRRQLKDAGEVLPGRYRCDKCARLYERHEIHIDHIKPKVDPTAESVNYDELINSWFCDVTNLQRLCYICHKAKTRAEGVVRTTTRRKYKKRTPTTKE